MKFFEYRQLWVAQLNLIEYLNEMGVGGWELCSTSYLWRDSTDGYVCILKREVEWKPADVQIKINVVPDAFFERKDDGNLVPRAAETIRPDEVISGRIHHTGLNCNCTECLELTPFMMFVSLAEVESEDEIERKRREAWAKHSAAMPEFIAACHRNEEALQEPIHDGTLIKEFNTEDVK